MKTVPSDGRDQERDHTYPRRQNRLGFYIDFGKSCMARRWETFFSQDAHRAGQQKEGSPKVALIIQIGKRKKMILQRLGVFMWCYVLQEC